MRTKQLLGLSSVKVLSDVPFRIGPGDLYSANHNQRSVITGRPQLNEMSEASSPKKAARPNALSDLGSPLLT